MQYRRKHYTIAQGIDPRWTVRLDEQTVKSGGATTRRRKLGEAGIPALRLVAYFESASGLIRPGPACHTTVACHLLD
jgi:hypothetical protein